MSKKKLLNESEVRRFMGLAGLNPINEMGSYKMEEEEPEVKEEAYKMEEEEPEMKEGIYEDEEEPMEEGMYEEGEGMSEEDIMEEVARRVAKRLLETKNQG